MIEGLDIVTMYVGHQERALAFYRDRLGMEVRTDEKFGGGQRWLEVAPPGAATRLVLYAPPGTEERIGRSSVLVLRCADARAAFDTLRERGVVFAQEPTPRPWGLETVCHDPDGNSLVLVSG